ncbi:TetR/AcrR family transcriptional regulator [Nocardioides jejuensis]|uniref:TetR/AcrR family transcriptional regulator n=1 Tax=Nocardioides jejuensis TaxID=2502782 RepID=A0A4R1CHX1_9ACTN|nr:TetR/AcrR family transcriptional regulator [Nocardioides jejuensis]TCJ31043.1 TetR/AcrR family transcriptional regulator [Nocardioides jejuensis]
MSTASYHHGNLRQALVDEAVAVTRESGPDAIKIRDLARRVGVSHNAAYGHFANRDDLMAAVADHAYQRLVDAMHRRVAAVDTVDPVLRARRRLAQIGRAYVEFAVAEPGLFRAAFTAPSRGDTLASAAGPYALLGSALDELVDVGFLSPAARPGAEVTCWSAVHGFSDLNIDGPLASASPDVRAATLDHVLVSIDRSYAATTGSTVSDSDILES